MRCYNHRWSNSITWHSQKHAKWRLQMIGGVRRKCTSLYHLCKKKKKMGEMEDKLAHHIDMVSFLRDRIEKFANKLSHSHFILCFVHWHNIFACFLHLTFVFFHKWNLHLSSRIDMAHFHCYKSFSFSCSGTFSDAHGIYIHLCALHIYWHICMMHWQACEQIDILKCTSHLHMHLCMHTCIDPTQFAHMFLSYHLHDLAIFPT